MYIKGFDKELKCRDFQFEVGKEYMIELNGREPELCTDTVFHFCDSLSGVDMFYPVNKDNRYCEIEALDKVVRDKEKCGCAHIKVVREIVGEELNFLKGLVHGNSGKWNSGKWNSGNWNSGNGNSGNCNSGHSNSGDWNSGNGNSCNWNSGNCNSGGYNSGNGNSGDWNSGDSNSGNWNNGDWNSGNGNSGNCNSGHSNSGDWNSGIFNCCNYSAGAFCTHSPKMILFDKPSEFTIEEFLKTTYWYALQSVRFKLTEWVYYTEAEQEADTKKKETGGYLKVYTYEEACRNWWQQMSFKNRKVITEIPNFDWAIFTKITGIKKEEL